MTTPRGPEVGDVRRADALPCGCSFEPGYGWYPCPLHPTSCQAAVAWQDQARTVPLARCGVPTEDGDRFCADHLPRCESCNVQDDDLDADNRCGDCAGEARRNRASLSRN